MDMIVAGQTPVDVVIRRGVTVLSITVFCQRGRRPSEYLRITRGTDPFLTWMLTTARAIHLGRALMSQWAIVSLRFQLRVFGTYMYTINNPY
jgi:hypothetical protein